MDGLILSSQQILDGAATLEAETGKLTTDQVDDLVSVSRGYLGSLASNFTLRETFSALANTPTNNRAAKLAACLLLWQDNQFDVSGFAATAANKTGYNDSTAEENFEIFKYAFGLFWDLPPQIELRWTTRSGKGFAQGKFQRGM